MTRQEILENIKAQFKKLMFESATTTLTTTDGKNIIVMGEDATVGLEVYLLDADNNQTPLDNGEYTLPDGRTIVVADGKISDLKLPDAEKVEEPIVEEMAEEAPVAENAIEPNAEIAELKSQVAELMTVVQGFLKKTEQVMSAQTELTTKVQTLSEQPSAEKIVVPKKLSAEKSISDKMKEVREIMKSKL